MKRGTRPQGLSLLELIFSLNLLFLITGFVFAMIVYGMRMPTRNVEVIRVEQAASDHLETLLRQPFGTPMTTSPQPYSEDSDITIEAVSSPSNFESNMLVLTVTATGPTGLQRSLSALRPVGVPIPWYEAGPAPSLPPPSEWPVDTATGDPIPPPPKLEGCLGCHGSGEAYENLWDIDTLRADASNYYGVPPEELGDSRMRAFVYNSIKYPDSYVASSYTSLTGRTSSGMSNVGFPPMGPFGAASSIDFGDHMGLSDSEVIDIIDWLLAVRPSPP